MAILLWLAIPVVAAIGAAAWMATRGRDASPEQQQQGITEMQRFQEAMLKPLPRRDDEA